MRDIIGRDRTLMVNVIMGDNIYERLSPTSKRIIEQASREDFFIWLLFCNSLNVSLSSRLEDPDWPSLPCFVSAEGRGVRWSVVDSHQNNGSRLHRLGSIIQSWEHPMVCHFMVDAHYTAEGLSHLNYRVYPSLKSLYIPILKEMYKEYHDDETVFTLEYLVKKFDDAINEDGKRWFIGGK